MPGIGLANPLTFMRCGLKKTFTDDLSVDEFSKITTSLFSAAIGKIGWEDFLSEISAHSGGICTHIFGFDTEAGVSIAPILHGYDPEYIRSYDEYYGSINAWATGFATYAPGQTIDSELMCRAEELQKTEFYNDWVKPQENIMQGGGAMMFKNDTRFFAIGGNIRQKDAQRLKAPWLLLVDRLIPHLQQAFEIKRALAGQRLETAFVAREGLRETPAIVLLSEFGRIVFANGIAERMLSIGCPISVSHSGYLAFGTEAETGRISREFLGMHLNGTDQSFLVSVQSKKTGQTFQLRFAKLTAEAQIALPFDASLGVSGRCVVLIITEQAESTNPLVLLHSRYGLTKAEADVASMIAAGFSIQEIADHRSTSIHTVRYQTKSALAKTGSSRQADLVRVVQNLRPKQSLFGR